MEQPLPCDAARLMPDAPASVQAVLCTLEDHEPRTNRRLQEETGLPRRTLYTALQKLKEQGLIKQKISLSDTRQSYFWMPDAVAAS